VFTAPPPSSVTNPTISNHTNLTQNAPPNPNQQAAVSTGAVNIEEMQSYANEASLGGSPGSMQPLIQMGRGAAAYTQASIDPNTVAIGASFNNAVSGASMAGFNALVAGFADVFNAAFNGGNAAKVGLGLGKSTQINQVNELNFGPLGAIKGVSATGARGFLSESAAYLVPGGAILHGIGDTQEGMAARAFDIGAGSLFFLPGLGAGANAAKDVAEETAAQIATRIGAGAGAGAAFGGIGSALRGGSLTQDFESAAFGGVLGAAGAYFLPKGIEAINTKGLDVYASDAVDTSSLRDIGLTAKPATESTDTSSIEGVIRGNPPRFNESNVVGAAGRGNELDYLSNVSPTQALDVRSAPGGVDYSDFQGLTKGGKPLYGSTGEQVLAGRGVGDELASENAADAFANRTAMLKVNEITTAENIYGVDEVSNSRFGFRQVGSEGDWRASDFTRSGNKLVVVQGTSEPLTDAVSYETRVVRTGPDVGGTIRNGLGSFYGKEYALETKVAGFTSDPLGEISFGLRRLFTSPDIEDSSLSGYEPSGRYHEGEAFFSQGHQTAGADETPPPPPAPEISGPEVNGVPIGGENPQGILKYYENFGESDTPKTDYSTGTQADPWKEARFAAYGSQDNSGYLFLITPPSYSGPTTVVKSIPVSTQGEASSVRFGAFSGHEPPPSFFMQVPSGNTFPPGVTQHAPPPQDVVTQTPSVTVFPTYVPSVTQLPAVIPQTQQRQEAGALFSPFSESVVVPGMETPTKPKNDIPFPGLLTPFSGQGGGRRGRRGFDYNLKVHNLGDLLSLGSGKSKRKNPYAL
jgi:hypothetical protein